MRASLLALALAAVPVGAAEQAEETLVSLDAREAEVREVAAALARLGGLQIVFDPDVSCELTVKAERIRWSAVLDAVLGACRLGAEGEGSVVRVAPTERLSVEADRRRALAEAEAALAPRSLSRFRLAYARARELAPLLEKILAPGSQVVYDERTNTLLLVARAR